LATATGRVGLVHRPLAHVHVGRRAICASAVARDNGVDVDAVAIGGDYAPRTLPDGALAIDCEMVKVRTGRTGSAFALGHVCIVDALSERTVYESYVRPEGTIVDYVTRYSGLTEAVLRSAPPFAQVRGEVLALLDGRTIVGHGLDADFKVLRWRPTDAALVADTSQLPWGPRLSLKLRDLVREELNLDVQSGAHNPAEDALAALRLYAHFLRVGAAEACKPRVLTAALSGLPAEAAQLAAVPTPSRLRRLAPDALDYELEWTRAGVRAAVDWLDALAAAGATCAALALPASLHKDTRRRLHSTARAAGGASISVGTGAARHARLIPLCAAPALPPAQRQSALLSARRSRLASSGTKGARQGAGAGGPLSPNAAAHVAFARTLFAACGAAGGLLCVYSLNELAEMARTGEWEADVAQLLRDNAHLRPPPPDEAADDDDDDDDQDDDE
jgi:DNA polymerase III epsilon subunit-like protein